MHLRDMRIDRGIIKTHVPQTAFLDCVSASRPFNTLFSDIKDVQNVVLEDLELFLPLVLALYAHSPIGSLAVLQGLYLHA